MNNVTDDLGLDQCTYLVVSAFLFDDFSKISDISTFGIAGETLEQTVKCQLSVSQLTVGCMAQDCIFIVYTCFLRVLFIDLNLVRIQDTLYKVINVV